MDFRELRFTLRRHARVALAAFLACVLLGAAAAFLPERTYATEATIVIDPRAAVSEGVVTVQQVNFGLPALREKAQSRSLRQRLREEMPAGVRDTPVRIEALIDSSVLHLRGTSSSPQAAQVWVNAVAQELVEDTKATDAFKLSLLDDAPLRQQPVSPHIEPIMVGSLVLGAILAVFAALGVQRLRDASDGSNAVRDRVGTTVLGEVPDVRDLRKGRVPLLRMLEDEVPRDLITAFETIRTNLEFRLAQTQATSVAVISYDAGTGRSTLTAGLGYAMAAVGRDVILVEADLRKPTLPEKLAVGGGRGLGGMAVLGSDRPQVQTTAYPNLRLLSAGVPAGRAADVVTTTLPRALETLDSPSRLIIIDTPPQKHAPESALAAALAGHVILVINSTPTDFMGLPASIARIQESGAVLLGVVINRVPRRRLRRERAQRDARLAPAALLRDAVEADVAVPVEAGANRKR